MRQQRRRNDPVTPKQIAMLHVAKATLEMEEEDYRLLLESYGGVSSSKELKQESFKRIGMPEPHKQEAFIRRMLKKPAPVMKYEANKVIEALKKMAARGFKAGERSDGRYEKAADA